MFFFFMENCIDQFDMNAEDLICDWWELHKVLYYDL